MPDLFVLSPNASQVSPCKSTQCKTLTFDHSTYTVQTHDHAYHTAKRLLSPADNVKHVTATASDNKRPTAQDDINLRLGIDVSDASLGEDLVQIKPIILR